MLTRAINFDLDFALVSEKMVFGNPKLNLVNAYAKVDKNISYTYQRQVLKLGVMTLQSPSWTNFLDKTKSFLKVHEL